MVLLNPSRNKSTWYREISLLMAVVGSWNQKALNWSCQTVAVQSKKIVELGDENGFIMLLLLK